MASSLASLKIPALSSPKASNKEAHKAVAHSTSHCSAEEAHLWASRLSRAGELLPAMLIQAQPARPRMQGVGTPSWARVMYTVHSHLHRHRTAHCRLRMLLDQPAQCVVTRARPTPKEALEVNTAQAKSASDKGRAVSCMALPSQTEGWWPGLAGSVQEGSPQQLMLPGESRLRVRCCCERAWHMEGKATGAQPPNTCPPDGPHHALCLMDGSNQGPWAADTELPHPCLCDMCWPSCRPPGAGCFARCARTWRRAAS